jgi:putative sugar O-methyltransferase
MNTVDQQVIADIEAVAQAQTEQAPGTSAIWGALGKKHRQLIERHGFNNFKRTINFEYGQWGVTSFRNPHLLRVLRQLLRIGKLPTAVLGTRFDTKEAAGIIWSDSFDAATGELIGTARPRLTAPWAYAVYCGLLWQYAKATDELGCLDVVEEPEIGNPLPVKYFGRRISQDLAMATIEMNQIAKHVPLNKVRRVLEIGAGYGRLAHPFCTIFQDVQYFIVDISPALAVGQNYLSQVFGRDAVAKYGETALKRINFMLPHQLKTICEGFFDLTLNISSFDEMHPDTVAGYLDDIARIGKGGYLYLNGHDFVGTRARQGLENFPYKASWQQIHSGPHPVAPGFVEKAFLLT